MFEFLDRFISIAVPRMRDFRGLPTKSFDGAATTRSASRSNDFSRDRLRQSRAHSRMDITFVTSAGATTRAGLLREMGMPFRAEARARRLRRTHGEEGVVGTGEARPKFKVRGYYRCQRCGRARGTLASSSCAAFVSVSLRCAGRFPACAKPAG